MRVDPTFQALREEHFDRLCGELGLSELTSQVVGAFAIVSAAAGNVRVFFEHDRGLCIFGLGAFTDAKPFCSVEEIAQRFPRVRIVPEGVQRLSLEEQRSFVGSRWSALQTMFAPEHIVETRRWHDALVRRVMQGFPRGS
jgi:hypothetical protein